MHIITFVEGVMRSLTTCQKNEIRSSNNEYVNFIISAFNAGVVIRTEMSDSSREIPEDEWNDYDFALPTTDVIELLDKHSL